jgi:Methyltransferase domain
MPLSPLSARQSGPRISSSAASSGCALSEQARNGSAELKKREKVWPFGKMTTRMNRALRGVFRWGRVLAQVAAYPLVAGSKTRRQRFRFAAEALRHQLPLVSLSKIINTKLADEDKISLQALPEYQHNCSILELFTLAALARAVNPSLCLEIGTYDGRSALAIASNCNAEARVVTMNLPPNYLKEHPDKSEVVDVKLSAKVKSGERWVGRRESRQIEQIFANSLEFDFASIGRPQFIFIDGAHDQPSVESDSENALRVIDRRKGVIVWHDARDYGVRPALRRLYGRGYPVCIIEHTNLAVILFEGGAAIRPV